MSIEAALYAALEVMTPTVLTAKPNYVVEPPADEPYQRAAVLFAEPDNSEFGPNFSDLGFMQVTLCAPAGEGEDWIRERLDMLRTTFSRGTAITNGSKVVTISRTPWPMPGQSDGAHWAVPVRIVFNAPN